MKYSRFLALFALAAVPCLASAQNRTAIALGAGRSQPLGKLRDTQTPGVDLNLGIIRGSDEAPLGLRLDFGYDKLPGKTVNGVKLPDRQTLSGTANVVFGFSGYAFKPYVLAGGGAFKMTSKPAAAGEKARFGFDFGFGVTIPVANKAVFLESRVNSIVQHQAKPVRYLPIIFGLLF
jgi:hypothetical protein